MNHTCRCSKKIANVPFQKGDKVVYKGQSTSPGLVRTVTHVSPCTPGKDVDGGIIRSHITAEAPKCKKCGKPVRCKRQGYADGWFRRATKADISRCRKVYGTV